MSTKNPFFVSPPSDSQSYGSGKFYVSFAGTNIKISLDGGISWQYLPANIDFGRGSLESINDATTNSNSKTFTVPSGEIWEIYSIFYEYQATATAGTRSPALYVRNPEGKVIGEYDTQHTVTANGNQRYLFSEALPNTSVSIWHYNPFMKTILDAGSFLKIYDVANIDSNDDFTINISYRRADMLKMRTIEFTASDLQISWSDSILESAEQKVHVLKLD
jgi:hypothetical protein